MEKKEGRMEEFCLCLIQALCKTWHPKNWWQWLLPNAHNIPHLYIFLSICIDLKNADFYNTFPSSYHPCSPTPLVPIIIHRFSLLFRFHALLYGYIRRNTNQERKIHQDNTPLVKAVLLELQRAQRLPISHLWHLGAAWAQPCWWTFPLQIVN